jgi:hypothetical protein
MRQMEGELIWPLGVGDQDAPLLSSNDSLDGFVGIINNNVERSCGK